MPSLTVCAVTLCLRSVYRLATARSVPYVIGSICIRLVGAVAFLGLMVGCNRSGPTFQVEAPRGGLRESKEQWHAIYLGGVHVGHRQTTHTNEKDGRHIRSQQQIRIDRDGQAIEMRVVLESWLDESLVLKRFRAETFMGTAPIVVEGIIEGDSATVSTTTSSTTTGQMEWNSEQRGFFGMELDFAKSVPEVGQEREMWLLVPLADQILSVKHTVRAEALEPIGDGTNEQRLRLRVTADIAGQPIESFVWVDNEGQMVRSENPTMQLVEVRTTEQLARASKANRLDLFELASVKLQRPIPQPPAESLTFDASVHSGEVSSLLTDGPNQRVETVSNGIVRIHTSAQPSSFSERPPEAADLDSTALIESDSPLIQEQASRIGSGATGMDLALAIERWVHETVAEKNYAQGFASAAEVMRIKQGDCTEHAVLVAALARARKLPARLVTGLIYVPTRSAFVFHMWNEIWVEDTWTSFDATRGNGGISAQHIKLSETNLGAGETEQAFLPVLQVMNQLQLRFVYSDSKSSAR